MKLKTLRAQFLVECLDLPAATGVEDARWEPFQISHLNDDSTFRIENKSRQIAWSWTSAMEALAEAVLEGRSSIFVSINQAEATEKIRYGKTGYESLTIGGLPRLVRDSQLMLEFENGARLISLPARAPRGKARMNVYLDEFAHVRDDRKIYTAALPVMSKGGRLRMGSSPMGASGVFWEIFDEKLRRYPGYTRKRTPWWEVQAFCRNVKEARRLAPAMPTAARVDLFGRDAIKAIYANMVEEDFRQEYEAEFVDESTAWITWDELREVTDAKLACVLASGKDQAFAAINQVAHAARTGEIEVVFAAGMDVGRTRNASEIFVTGLSTVGSFPLRLAITLENAPFDDQLHVLAHLVQSLPLTGLLIDRTGLGHNLAENMENLFPGKAFGVTFTQPNKVLWATDAKTLVQRKRTPLPADRDIAYQIHSIKRRVTAARNLVFDVDTNEKHHADKFWAWCLALVAGTAVLPQPEQTVIHDEPFGISPY